jgi:hypothetical protein
MCPPAPLIRPFALLDGAADTRLRCTRVPDDTIIKSLRLAALPAAVLECMTRCMPLFTMRASTYSRASEAWHIANRLEFFSSCVSTRMRRSDATQLIRQRTYVQGQGRPPPINRGVCLTDTPCALTSSRSCIMITLRAPGEPDLYISGRKPEISARVDEPLFPFTIEHTSGQAE